MSKKPISRTAAKSRQTTASRAKRAAAAATAVVGVYRGGFLWQEISPAAYSVVFLLLASVPLLLKVSFWKKLLLLFPLLIVRVTAKVLIKVFGLKAMEKLFRRYGLLEERYNRVIEGFDQTRVRLINRWNGLARSTQAHLILTFLPFLALLAIALLVVEILRLRVFRMVVEKIMQKGMQGRVKQGVHTLSTKVNEKKTKHTAFNSDDEKSATSETTHIKPADDHSGNH